MRTARTVRTDEPTCYQAHLVLVDRALDLVERLAPVDQEQDLLRLGAACVTFASHKALAARYERDAIWGWRECALGERQIRLATFHALRRRRIATAEYDATFAAAIDAARARTNELLRLRLQLRLLSIY